MDINDVIQCAANLVDGPTEVNDDYRRGVVELAAALCESRNFDDWATVMGYAVCGVNRPEPSNSRGGAPYPACDRGPCVMLRGHPGKCSY